MLRGGDRKNGRGLLRGLSFAALALVAIAWPLVCAQIPPESRPSVAIYYDGPDQPLAEGFLDAHQIQNLLGHFGLTGEIIPVANYRPGQLDRYRAAFFLGTVTGTVFPRNFLSDIAASARPFCWIGRHIGTLLAARGSRGRFGFAYVDYRDDLDFRRVVYKGITLPKEDPDLSIVQVKGQGVEMVAEALSDDNVRRPYALRQGRFWYIADTPFAYAQEGGRYLVSCDLLHDILEINHPAQALALVRVEDVSADIDPADVRALADLLSGLGVPFQIGVIPIFRNPAKGYEIYLTDRPSLAEAVRYAVERGGAPVMHGITHQHRGVSADDYEFWDAAGNRAPAGDSAEAFLRKAGLGLRELVENGIFPVAFETPHYAASEADYRAMQEVFPLFYDRTMATPDISAIQFFPYPTIDRFGRYVVPENLGYLVQENPDPRVIIERARAMRVVRDAVASFYFHAFLDPALLGEVVRGVRSAGFRFVPLRQFGGGVHFRGRLVVLTSSGEARVEPAGEYWRLRLFDAAGRPAGERYSSSRLSGSVNVPAKPPPGGWAVVDTLKDLPQQARAPGWYTRLVAWWRGRQQTRRPLEGGERFSPATVWILSNPNATGGEALNERSYRHVFETFGYQTALVPVSEFLAPPKNGDSILVIPEAVGARLSPAQHRSVLGYLDRGGYLVVEGNQEWLTQAGFRWSGRRVPVSSVVDVLFPEMTLRWQPEVQVERFTPPEGSRQLLVDLQSKQTLALSASHGAGRFLHLAAPFDPVSMNGTSRYPYFVEYIREAFRIRSPQPGARLEVYFDPSFREGANLNRLAASWRQAGIRVIYAAAWSFSRSHEFDYSEFVRVCHRNGIAVYAWFVFPAVTEKMWLDHPEWRERTASGADGRVGWRYSMNFENPACYRAAMDWMKQTLAAHPWDGVNLTELNYDADFKDYLRPDRFVPMNADVRTAFVRRSGFDPALLFDPRSPRYHKRNPQALEQFLQYREDIVTAWHRKVLGELEPIRQRNGWEVIVTMLDNLHSEYVRPALGVNSRRIAGLMKEFDFTLQVEDTAEHWMKPPDRYRRFAETYRSLVPDPSRLMFDINVMPDRDVAGTTLPSARATGTELALTVLAAASASGRAAIYSEYTVASQDWSLIGAALAGRARVEHQSGGFAVDSPIPVRLMGYEGRDYYRGGKLWPAVWVDGVTVPPGRYKLAFERPWFQFLDRAGLPARVLHLSADLLDARVKPTGLGVRYRSPGRAVLVLNQKPLAVRINGREATADAGEGDGRWAIVLPRGAHDVEIDTASRSGVLVNLYSYAFVSVITAFGVIATILMSATYLRLRLRRATRNGGAS